MTSIVFLLLNTKSKPKVSLIGREAFKLTYDGVEIHNYQSMHLPFISKDIKPDGIEEIDLDFSKTTKTYYPAFKNNLYNLEYDYETTICHYYLMVECFKICTNDLLKKYNYSDVLYVYNKQLITNPSSNETRMPLMNEVIFFPTLNTYIMCINKFDNILESFNSELLKINKQTNYKSDIDLTIIIKSFIR